MEEVLVSATRGGDLDDLAFLPFLANLHRKSAQ